MKALERRIGLRRSDRAPFKGRNGRGGFIAAPKLNPKTPRH